MKKEEMTTFNYSVPATVSGKIYDLISETVIKKAMVYIRHYDNETGAIVFEEGFNAIRDMCRKTETLRLDKNSYEFKLITEELKEQIKIIANIVQKVYGRKGVPTLSSNDQKMLFEVEQDFRRILGVIPNLSLKEVTPLLLEAKNMKQK